jgi:hypothetical protein
MVRFVMAPLAVVLVLAAGTWLLGGQVATSRWWAIGLTVAWFLAVSAIVARVGRRHDALRVPTRVAFVGCAVLSTAAFLWTSVRETRVDETVVMAGDRIEGAQRDVALRGEPRRGEAEQAGQGPSDRALPLPTTTTAPSLRPRRPQRRRRRPATSSCSAGTSAAPTVTRAAGPRGW